MFSIISRWTSSTRRIPKTSTARNHKSFLQRSLRFNHSSNESSTPSTFNPRAVKQYKAYNSRIERTSERPPISSVINGDVEPSSQYGRDGATPNSFARSRPFSRHCLRTLAFRIFQSPLRMLVCSTAEIGLLATLSRAASRLDVCRRSTRHSSQYSRLPCFTRPNVFGQSRVLQGNCRSVLFTSDNCSLQK